MTDIVAGGGMPWGFRDLGEDAVTVCTTHRRFVPCRRGPEGCQLSSEDNDVKKVRRYHEGSG